MSDDYRSEIRNLVGQTNRFGEGQEKIKLLEQAVYIADANNDVEQGFYTRELLIRAAIFGGDTIKAIQPFLWCLSEWDKNPVSSRTFDLLWKYKWVVSGACFLTQVSVSKLEEMFVDMEARYDKANASKRSIYSLRCTLARSRGDKDGAARYFSLWQEAKRDSYTDCVACETNSKAKHFIFMEEDEKALDAVKPILSGQQRCAEVPHTTLATVLMPMFRLGRLQEAVNAHLKGYRLISSNEDFLSDISSHMLFLSVTQNLTKAVNIFKKHLSWALKSSEGRSSFDFYLAAKFLLEQLQEKGRKTIKIRLSGDKDLVSAFPLYDDKAIYKIPDLLSWITQEAQKIADKFDKHSGTQHLNTRIEKTNQLREKITPFPITQPRVRNSSLQ